MISLKYLFFMSPILRLKQYLVSQCARVKPFSMEVHLNLFNSRSWASGVHIELNSKSVRRDRKPRMLVFILPPTNTLADVNLIIPPNNFM